MSHLPSHSPRPLPSLLPIRPFTRPAHGTVTLPGSKSITNRALLLAALCDGPVTLTGALFSEDTEIMAEALRQLGFAVKVDAEAKTICVEGRGGEIPAKSATLHVGLAGTAARFLTALCAAAKEGVYRLDGVPQMRKRPMKGLIDALRALGADIRCPGEEGFFPLEIRARGLRGGPVEIDASESSQMLSALLMVAPLAAQEVSISFGTDVRMPFIRMTALMLEQFGQDPIHAADLPQHGIRIRNTRSYARNNPYHIEPDMTAASYFMALPLVATGSLCVSGLRNARLQGDILFWDLILRAGAAEGDREPANDGVVFSSNARRGVTQDFSTFSDTFLTLAAIAPLLDGPTTITGIAHTRKQETDRVAGAARELKKLGHDVVETHDSLTLTPNLAEMKKRAAQGLIEIETYGDHRFAMSFAILGCHDLRGDGSTWLAIRNPACCAKTFPNFFDVLAEVRNDSHPPHP